MQKIRFTHKIAKLVAMGMLATGTVVGLSSWSDFYGGLHYPQGSFSGEADGSSQDGNGNVSVNCLQLPGLCCTSDNTGVTVYGVDPTPAPDSITYVFVPAPPGN